MKTQPTRRGIDHKSIGRAAFLALLMTALFRIGETAHAQNLPSDRQNIRNELERQFLQRLLERREIERRETERRDLDRLLERRRLEREEVERQLERERLDRERQ